MRGVDGPQALLKGLPRNSPFCGSPFYINALGGRLFALPINVPGSPPKFLFLFAVSSCRDSVSGV